MYLNFYMFYLFSYYADILREYFNVNLFSF